MLIIIGIPLFFYLLVIWFFAISAVVIEGMGGDRRPGSEAGS